MLVQRNVLASRGVQGSSRITGFIAGLSIVLLGLVAAVPVPAATPPTIDGNVDDLILFVADLVASPTGNLGTGVDDPVDEGVIGVDP